MDSEWIRVWSVWGVPSKVIHKSRGPFSKGSTSVKSISQEKVQSEGRLPRTSWRTTVQIEEFIYIN